jgi:hypothetical protein
MAHYFHQKYFMKKSFFAALLICMTIGPGFAQSNIDHEKAVKMVIDKLFMGMQKGDSTMVREAFTSQVSLATIFRTKTDGSVMTRENSLEGFLKAVGTPHKETWYEEYWNLKIDIDGDLASAWCDYAFYVDNNFSHCGVDAFQLHKENDGWKIFHLADTRRKTGCEIPAEVQNKHK